MIEEQPPMWLLETGSASIVVVVNWLRDGRSVFDVLETSRCHLLLSARNAFDETGGDSSVFRLINNSLTHHFFGVFS